MILLRHASAGDSSKWEGDDNERPLDKRGRKQAQKLVEELAPFTIQRILSSPAVRCVETVVPLAQARGLEIEQRAELGEELQGSEGAELVRDLVGTRALVCGHGGLERAIPGAPHLKKGAFFVVD
jgi:phosphohistidine phosphatase SixA